MHFEGFRVWQSRVYTGHLLVRRQSLNAALCTTELSARYRKTSGVGAPLSPPLLLVQYCTATGVISRSEIFVAAARNLQQFNSAESAKHVRLGMTRTHNFRVVVKKCELWCVKADTWRSFFIRKFRTNAFDVCCAHHAFFTAKMQKKSHNLVDFSAYLTFFTAKNRVCWTFL